MVLHFVRLKLTLVIQLLYNMRVSNKFADTLIVIVRIITLLSVSY